MTKLSGASVLLAAALVCTTIANGEDERPRAAPKAKAAALDVQAINRVTGLKGTFDEAAGVYRAFIPRTDVTLSVDGTRVIPRMGTTSWVTLKKKGRKSLLAGELVLTDDQVNVVLSEVLRNGVEVTSLGNNFLWDSPRMMFMHLATTGDFAQIVEGLGEIVKVLRASNAARHPTPVAMIDPARTTMNPRLIDDIMGIKGETSDGVHWYTSEEPTKMYGDEAGEEMGASNWAGFAGTDITAAAHGQVMAVSGRIYAVLKALRDNGLYVVGVRNHMVAEAPRLTFVHFWGVGSSRAVATGVRAAFDAAK